MEMIQQTTSVKGTLSRMKDWLQDWCSAYTRQGYAPIHSMVLENGDQKIYWHFSGKPAAISRLSFIF